MEIRTIRRVARTDDDGLAVHYTAVQRGTPVIASDGTEVGTVERVLDNYREHILDGFVISTARGLRFVDGPEVERTAERAVRLNIDSQEAARLPEPEPTQLGSARGAVRRLGQALRKR